MTQLCVVVSIFLEMYWKSACHFPPIQIIPDWCTSGLTAVVHAVLTPIGVGGLGAAARGVVRGGGCGCLRAVGNSRITSAGVGQILY